MNIDSFCRRWGRVYHLTRSNNLPLIERLGLLSTAALLEECGVDPETRRRILTEIRIGSITVQHAGTGGDVIIRDQCPLRNEAWLRRVVPTMSQAEYLEPINQRVFFWVDPRDSDRLRAVYDGTGQVLLTFDTQKLLNAVADRVELCRLNSGSVNARDTNPRDLTPLFVPFREWQGGPARVHELTVLDRVDRPERFYAEDPIGLD